MPALVEEKFLAMAREFTRSRVGGYESKQSAPSPLGQPESYGRDRLGIAGLADAPRISLRPPFSLDEFQGALYAIYRQIFGNTYVMESERPTTAESQLKDGKISVRGFVRLLAKSEIYKSRFFHKTNQNRFIELNHKLLLGRAPYDQSEIVEHLDRYIAEGYEAEIDSYLDSEEYQTKFGEDIVPYPQDFQYTTGNRGVAYTRLLNLYGGWAASDTDRNQGGQKARLIRPLALNQASPAIRPSALTDIWKEASANYGVVPKRDMPSYGLEPFLNMARDLLGNRPERLAQEYTQPSKYQQTDSFGQERIKAVGVLEVPKVTLRAPFSEQEVQGALYAIYRQIFGNTYVMESERPTTAESQLRDGKLTVRGFIRLLAKSEIYKSRFFHKTSQNRFIELNHKLLLGRAPYQQSEIATHLDLYIAKGYEAEIDSYFDSEEYLEFFGEDTVPYLRGFKYQVGQSAEAFPRMVTLYDGWAGSDTDRNIGGQVARLNTNLVRGTSQLQQFLELAYNRR